MQVFIHEEGTGEVQNVTVQPSWCIEDVKKEIERTIGAYKNDQVLVYDASEVEDATLLSDIGIGAEGILVLRRGAMSVARKWLQEAKIPCTSRGLCDALRNKQADIVEKLLLGFPSCADTYDLVSDATPLATAAQVGNLNIARKLLSMGASPSFVNSKGQDPFFIACIHGHLAIAELLLPCSNPHSRDTASHSPLYWAAANKHYHVIKFLLTNGALPDTPTFLSTLKDAPSSSALLSTMLLPCKSSFRAAYYSILLQTPDG
eukprot:TRINITY_DN20195_c0_g1_i1.p1 TRINITY_DN20195_c0_g1~~TRINITY_DN20195_c0_g1_i1.p1  ORF type:complete len:276 (+),score=42.49 TRINITY_DN20195_c0_g1_i1:47-829(+)